MIPGMLCYSETAFSFWVSSSFPSGGPRHRRLGAVEPDLTDIVAHHQHVQDRPSIRSAGVSAAFGRQMNSVRHDIVRRELGSRKTTRNIHGIVVAAQVEIGIEKELLSQAV